ncbi:hypothetical protein AFE_2317 [Acidithiobacillus ferrooxidans ATCC 23270]|uniref:Uncharacterized protein n=1 Tax=Acidithiobacillus ferrooxidans (strain ATCC 23270 / DSM 14882 / CIP 104768 / NCIMB 8455) TaxID=243159 RepID=B7J686_ACIF2|nr:hypothetical protein AFE_2317 [Acidithiobacillus ferrooxidans ATCC 23270]
MGASCRRLVLRSNIPGKMVYTEVLTGQRWRCCRRVK